MAQRILVTLDGAVLDPDVPLLHADDLAAVRGDGVFETLLVRGGKARCVGLHLERLARSAAALDLPAPDERAWRSAIETGARTWAKENSAADGSSPEGLMRLVYSRGREIAPVDQVVARDRAETGITRESNEATAYVTVNEVSERMLSARRDGVSAITLDRGYSVDYAQRAPWALLGAKTLSYAANMAAQRYAQKQGADDVIYVSSEGQVLESPRSTVIVVRGRSLVTPPPEKVGILSSTTQQALFAAAQREGWDTAMEPLRTADLIQADAVWLLSSVTLAARVRELNGFTLTAPHRPEDFLALVDKAIAAE